MSPTGQAGVVLALAGGWLDLLLYGSCLAGALLVAAAVIEVVRRWLKRGERPQTPGDQLAHYRTLYRQGEISQEEFDSLRAVLGGEIQKAVRPPAPPPAPQAKPAAGPPPPTPPADGVRPE